MSLPPPDEVTKAATFAFAESAGAFSKEPGTIAVATSTKDETLYVAFSPVPQAGLKTKTSFKNLEVVLGAVICLEVSDSIASAYIKDNPGCAEKKLISTFIKHGLVMNSLCVRPFPDVYELAHTVSYEAISGSDGYTLKPCSSCESASNGLPKPKVVHVPIAKASSYAPPQSTWKGWGVTK